jgi:hypothetical protein
MTAPLPVANYLKELNADAARRGLRGVGVRDGGSEAELRLEEARANGVLEGLARAQAEREAALAEQASAFEQKLTSERQRWAAEQGAVFGERIGTALDILAHGIAEQVGRVLKPVLLGQARSKAVRELSEALEEMLSKGNAAKIVISGPRDLLAALVSRLGNGHANVTFVEAEGVDLKVLADETIIETRIAAWAQAIEGDTA